MPDDQGLLAQPQDNSGSGLMPPGAADPSYYQQLVAALTKARDTVNAPFPPTQPTLGASMAGAVPFAANMMTPAGGAPLSIGQKILTGAGFGSQLIPSEATGGEINTDPTEKEQAEISRINGAIGDKQKVLASIARRYSNDPQKIAAMSAPHNAAIQTLQGQLEAVQGQNSPLGQRRAAALKLQADAEARAAQSQEALQARTTESQLPYAVKYPERQAWLQEHMPQISAATGTALGLLGKGKILKPFLMGAGAGGFEGAATAAWPTLQDTEFLPAGENWKAAASRLEGDPDFLKRVGAATATHAALGGGAALAGAKVRDALGQAGEALRGIRGWFGGGAGEAAAAAAPKVRAVGKAVTLPDGSTAMRYEHPTTGRVSWKQGGKFIAAPDLSGKVTPMRGGLLNP